jgi:hypothetical protein
MTGGDQQLRPGVAGPPFGVFEVTDDDLVARNVAKVVSSGGGDGGDNVAAGLGEQSGDTGEHVGFEGKCHPATGQDAGGVHQAVGESRAAVSENVGYFPPGHSRELAHQGVACTKSHGVRDSPDTSPRSGAQHPCGGSQAGAQGQNG